MNPSAFFNQVRAYNTYVLSAGLALLFGGLLAVAVLNTANWWNLALVGLGLLALALFLAANLAEVKAVGKKRATVVRANLTFVSLAMLGIVIGLNYIVSSHPVRFDLTSNKIYTLSDQTRDVLKKLTQDVDVTLFTSSRRSSAEIQKAQQLLEEYAKGSNKFHFKVVDGDKNPSEAKRLNITEVNTVVFQSGDNRKDVLQRDYVTYALQGRQPMPKFQGEAAFTQALMTMTDTTHLAVYFTEGHGEKDLSNPQPDGYNNLKSLLEKQNYDVKTVNLLTSGKIPDDAAVLAVLGPEKPFDASEEKLVSDYLQKGGKLVLFVDPTVKCGLDPLLKDYGVKLGDDIVVDPTSYAYPDIRALVPQYSYHAIVEKLSDSHMASILPFMRSVQKIDPGIKGVTQTVFLQTTDKGWGITNFKEKKPVYHPGLDTKGPVPLAIACEVASPGDPTKKTRLVVYGGSTFLANQTVEQYANPDLGVNTFSWATEQENKISIHPREDETRILNLTNVSVSLIFWVCVVIIPFGTLLVGGVLWWNRRSL